MINPTMIKFLKEAFNRLKTRAPRFFFILQLLGGSLIFLGYVPAMIDRWSNMMVSQEFINFCEDVSNWAKGFVLATLFSAESKPTAMTEGGAVIKKLDETKYPYSAEVEMKKVNAAEVPVVPDPLPKEPEKSP